MMNCRNARFSLVCTSLPKACGRSLFVRGAML
jgi:hypothetical protein